MEEESNKELDIKQNKDIINEPEKGPLPCFSKYFWITFKANSWVTSKLMINSLDWESVSLAKSALWAKLFKSSKAAWYSLKQSSQDWGRDFISLKLSSR